ncbi:MAG: hypothetical protein GY820_45300, partial [Gammaproteobacteria bacterium]|nr:hypothetical protein [Gammaproteobacteria bacterium]
PWVERRKLTCARTWKEPLESGSSSAAVEEVAKKRSQQQGPCGAYKVDAFSAAGDMVLLAQDVKDWLWAHAYAHLAKERPDKAPQPAHQLRLAAIGEGQWERGGQEPLLLPAARLLLLLLLRTQCESCALLFHFRVREF